MIGRRVMIGHQKESTVQALCDFSCGNVVASKKEPSVRTPCEVRHTVGALLPGEFCFFGKERHALPVPGRETIQRVN
eukprot:2658810-Alexandrium_andersonii.AAC.1